MAFALNRRHRTRLMIMRIKIKCIRLVRQNTWPTDFEQNTGAQYVQQGAKTQTAAAKVMLLDFSLNIGFVKT